MEWWILLCSCIRTWTLAFQCLGLKLRLLTIWLWKGEIQQVWPERKAWSGVDADLSSLKLKKCLRSSLMENNTKCLIFTIYTKTYQHITRSPWSALERTRPWQVMGTEVYFLKLKDKIAPGPYMKWSRTHQGPPCKFLTSICTELSSRRKGSQQPEAPEFSRQFLFQIFYQAMCQMIHLDFSKNIGDNVTEWKYKRQTKQKNKNKNQPPSPIGTNRDRLPIVSSGCFVSCLKNRNKPRKDNDRTQPLQQTQVSTC